MGVVKKTANLEKISDGPDVPLGCPDEEFGRILGSWDRLASGCSVAWRTWGLARSKKITRPGPQPRGCRRLKKLAQMSLEGVERHTLVCSHFFTGQARPFHCWGPGVPPGPPDSRQGFPAVGHRRSGRWAGQAQRGLSSPTAPVPLPSPAAGCAGDLCPIQGRLVHAAWVL